MSKKLFIVMILVLAGAILWTFVSPPPPIKTINDEEVKEAGTFDECVKEGNPVAQSYPPSCRTKSGKLITQNVGNELTLRDKIKIVSPRPLEKVVSPLSINGEARGTWFFEAQFSASLLDENGRILGTGVMTADSEWMTEEFVPYTGELVFNAPTGTKGKLILEKNNPSGIPQKDSQLIVPVVFE